MDEKRSTYRTIAEVASAGAVVISLIFVGLEVRETALQTELNTEALHIAAYQDLIGQIAQFNEVLLDPELAAVYAIMQDRESNWSALSPVQTTQAHRILFLIARHADMAYYQYERGLLPEERLTSALRPFISDMDAPIYRSFWDGAKANFVPNFREYVDAQIGAR